MTILIAATFCLASFGWGMVHHFRRFGKTTTGMRRTAILGATTAAMQVAGLAVHLKDRWALSQIIATVLYILSASLFWWAVPVSRGQLAACGQGKISACVLTRGPYRYIRHPFYTAYNLTWMAGLVATGWWPLALPVTVMALVYEESAREEERSFLHSSLATEYDAYRKLAGRYWPKLPVIQTWFGSRSRPLDR